jgi:hypothetical protein
MGAWGPASFENDTALEWLEDFFESDDDAILWDVLEFAAAPGDEEIDADAGCAALAAAEVLATAGGQPPPVMPEGLDELPREPLDRETYDLALRAVARVRQRSELAELWRESGDAGWLAAVADLEARLARARGAGRR